MGTKIGPKLVFDHMMIYQVLSDDMLWEKVPELLPLRVEGEATHHNIVEKVLRATKNCNSCSTVRAVVKPFQTKLGELLEALQGGDSGELDNFINYISVRRGYRPAVILVYYVGSDGTTKKLEL